MNICDECGQADIKQEIWATIKEQTIGPRGEHTRDTPRVFCSKACEEKFRAKWEVS